MLPNPPTNLFVLNGNFIWSPSDSLDVSGYNLYYFDSSSNITLIHSTTELLFNFNIPIPDLGFLLIKSFNSEGESDPLSIDLSTITRIPEPPTFISVINGTFNWMAPPNPQANDISGYNLYLSDDISSNLIFIETTYDTSHYYPVPIPDNGYFLVKAKNSYGESNPLYVDLSTLSRVPTKPELFYILNGQINWYASPNPQVNDIFSYHINYSDGPFTSPTLYVTRDPYYSPRKPYPLFGYYTIHAVNFYGLSDNLIINVNELINDFAGGGGPYIYPLIGDNYFLPKEDNCYLLYDNQDIENRIIITSKLWFLPESVKNESPYVTKIMNERPFFKYINIHYMGENLTIDMDTLNPVIYTNMSDVSNYNLIETINTNQNILINNFISEKLVFKKYYNIIRIKRNKINFNGRYKIINLNNQYQIKLTLDLNCADYRNEIVLLNVDYENAIGAFLNENINNYKIDYLVPNI
jgi:hypothetical protein